MRNMKFALLSLLLLAVATFGEVYIRYNFLGYSPSRQKRIVFMSDSAVTGAKWKLVNKTKNKTVLSGELEESVYGVGDHLPLPYNYVMDISEITEIADYELTIDGAKEPARFPIKKDPYGELVKLPLHWMRVARCGSHDAIDHGFCHGGDTLCTVHHRNGMDNGDWRPAESGKKVNGFGGWHDAADYLKFSLTNAYACYYLLRAYDINPELFDTMKVYSKSDLNDLLDEAKWGLDFLMKCMPDDDEFLVMVADSKDHNVGYRLPEDDELDGERPFLSALSAPQMGYTAAALALGASIFKKIGKEELAQQYGDMAERIFARAKSDDVVATAWLNDKANPFYADQTTNDNMELAAIELFRWTNNKEYISGTSLNPSEVSSNSKSAQYLQDAINYADKCRGAGWKAWESVNMPAHMLLMNEYPVAKNYLYLDLDGFLANSRAKGNIWGIPMKYVWAGLYSYIGVGASAIEFEIRTGERKYRSLARNMIDYLLGYNNWGICFVASEDLPNTITDPYSQVYNLQADKFPVGAISEGPGDRASWEKFKTYFGFDVNVERTNKFNTSKGVFYDKRKDFMCMETTICGVSDGIFMLAAASKMFQD